MFGASVHEHFKAAQGDICCTVKHGSARWIPAVRSVQANFKWLARIAMQTIYDQLKVPNSIAISASRTSRIILRIAGLYDLLRRDTLEDTSRTI